MFKCMESQSVHVIEIIKNGHTATERPEPTVSSSATNQAELSGLDSLRQFGLVLGVCQCTCAQCSVTGFRFIPPGYSFWKSFEAAMYFGAVLHYVAFLASGDKAWARFCCRTLLASPKSMASRDCLEPVAKESTTLNSCHSSLAIRTQQGMLSETPASTACVGTISIQAWEKLRGSTLIANPWHAACNRSGISMIAPKGPLRF